jgi:hypothetical protein
MKQLCGLLLLLLVQPAYSSGMAVVSINQGFCGRTEDKSAICHEWMLSSSPSIRFVAYGYEDGVEYSFYNLLPDDSYEHILRVHPVIRDSSRNNAFFWGYPWDIQDIALPSSKSRKSILATFDHSIIDDGEVYSPAWQKRIPAVLFIGRTTQPAMTVSPLKFKSSTLHGLRSGAGG